jgi:hypothetical protein
MGSSLSVAVAGVDVDGGRHETEGGRPAEDEVKAHGGGAQMRSQAWTNSAPMVKNATVATTKMTSSITPSG